MEIQGTRESSTPSPQPEACWPENWLPRKWALGLHHRFSILYLQKFTTVFQGQEAIDEWARVWAKALAGLDPDQIATGIEYCAANHQWPPTCAEFLIACKSKPKAVIALPQPPRIQNAEGQRRVAQIMAGLQAKPVDGRAYWRRVLDDPTTSAHTRQFAHEAMANLDDPNRGISA